MWSWGGFDYTARIEAKEISQGVKANSPQVREHLPVVRIAPCATETTKATVSAQIGGIPSVCPPRFQNPPTEGAKTRHPNTRISRLNRTRPATPLRNVLVSPLLVPDRQTIQLVPVKLPFGHVQVHQGDESGAVRRLQQVHQFVHHDVFQKLRWLFRQLLIQK